MKNQDKNQEIKLGAISGIDDEILERTSKKRFELWGRIKKKNPARVWIPVVAGAACIALLSGWLLGILPTLGKQIPVYQGMTVSHTPQTVAALPAEPTHDSLLAVSMAKANLSHSRPRALLKEGNNGNHYGQNKESDTDGLETESPSTLSGLEGARELYYAQRNQDIYITIHFSNPDDYEILSFTLNGEKYSSYTLLRLYPCKGFRHLSQQ